MIVFRVSIVNMILAHSVQLLTSFHSHSDQQLAFLLVASLNLLGLFLTSLSRLGGEAPLGVTVFTFSLFPFPAGLLNRFTSSQTGSRVWKMLNACTLSLQLYMIQHCVFPCNEIRLLNEAFLRTNLSNTRHGVRYGRDDIEARQISLWAQIAFVRWYELPVFFTSLHRP